VWPTPDELHLVYADFARHFTDIAIRVVELPPTDADPRPAHVIVSGAVRRAGLS
jgi:hypothetical protein